ncbi:MAG: glycosyltransferase family 39 protein [Chloroflexi bacterium]|nr:glycosyltransferase family 39 protein [Chloroflexota bacterium]
MTLAVAAVTALGGFLRFQDLAGWQYGLDELGMTDLAMGIVSRQSFPTGIPASVGIPNGPIAAYALAIPTLFSTSLVAAEGFWAACGTAGIPLMYLLARNLFGVRAGLLAAALFAVNPWMVMFGRRLWLNALIAPLAILLLWTLHRAGTRNRTVPWIVGGVALSASVQLHLSGIANGLAVAALLPAAAAFSWRGIALGAGSSLILMAPWLIGSALPALAGFDFRGASAASGWKLDSLEQGTLLVTGTAYQAIADTGLRFWDAEAQPFTVLDVIARLLAFAGWARLLWVGIGERVAAPARSATCLVAAAMAAIPILALARPPEAGNVGFVYAHYFINVGPPLILGIAALSAIHHRLVRRLTTSAAISVATAQLLLAFPFLATPQEEWHLGDFTIPWRFTDALVQAMRDRAAPEGLPIYVGGVGLAEQGTIAATLLRREYDRVRIHEGRDGIVYTAGRPRQLLVTASDDASMARFLRREYGDREIFAQQLPGGRWTRRIFELGAADLDRWTESHLAALPRLNTPLLQYERGSLLRAGGGSRQTLALLWSFQSAPTDHFFTDLVLLQGEAQVHRERHVAYPVAFWEPGDWATMKFLNLFELPDEVDGAAVTEVRIEHVGILTGRAVAPPLTFAPGDR